MHAFFSRVRVHHAERMPASGPVLIVSNHHSGLVDPVALLATMPRQPRFLAKAVLWKLAYLPLRPLLIMARAIPVYRQADGGGDNQGMFAATHGALVDGDVIALFAEGVSHNMPGLLDLKTGAARIALGAEADVAILPVGLIYDDRARFRSRAMIYLGEPIMVTGTAGGDQDRDRVRAVTAHIADVLDEVAPSWESWEAHNAAMVAARLAVAETPDRALGEVLTQLNRAVDDATTAGTEVIDAVQDLEAESARLGLDVETVVDRHASELARLDMLSYVKTAVLVVPTVLGRLLNLPPHALIARLSSSQKLNFQATFKILTALVVYPAWWLIVAVACAVVFHWAVGLVALVLLPALGYLAARTYGRLRRFRNRRAVRSRGVEVDGESVLVAARQRVLQATTAVLEAA